VTCGVYRDREPRVMGLIRLFIVVTIAYFCVRLLRNWIASLGQNPTSPSSAGDAATERAGPRQPRNAYDVLDLPSNASQDEIRAAYQRLVRQYHPDRVADMGPELRRIAEERTKEINEAYARLRRR